MFEERHSDAPRALTLSGIKAAKPSVALLRYQPNVDSEGEETAPTRDALE